MTKCPVCGNPVDPTTAPSYDYNGTTFYFKCDGCRNRFMADPAKYLQGGGHEWHGHGKHCH